MRQIGQRLTAWSLRMEGYGGPAQPSPTIGQCLNGGLGWLEVECNRCKTQASLPLDAITLCLFVASTRHRCPVGECLLPGEERTRAGRHSASANDDPKQTSRPDGR